MKEYAIHKLFQHPAGKHDFYKSEPEELRPEGFIFLYRVCKKEATTQSV